MKKRDPEAARLEEDYMTRVKSAMAGREQPDIENVVQLLRTQIEEKLSAKAGEEVSAAEMADVLEQLGPPKTYSKKGEMVGLALFSVAISSLGIALGISILSFLMMPYSLLFSFPGILLGAAVCTVAIVCSYLLRRLFGEGLRLGGGRLMTVGVIIGCLFLALIAISFLVIISKHGVIK
jgi:hypothetical protein